MSKRERSKPAKRTRPAPDGHGRTLRQADERAERLTALSRLTRLMTSATDSAAAIHGIAEAATILLKAKMAYVWVDHGADTLSEGGSYWAEPERAYQSRRTVPVPRDNSIAGSVLASRRPEYLGDVQVDPRWRPRTAAETSDLHACIALPLIHHDRAVGALIVGFGRRAGFTAEEKNLAGLLADQAAITIENARLYEEAGRRQREAELLTDVVRSVNASLDLATVLQRIAEGAREVCRSDMAFIALRDPASDTYVFRQWPGARYDDYRSFRIAPGQGASGLVIASGLPFRTDRYLEDSRIGPEFRAVARIEDLHAYMAVPIKIEDRVEGFFSVANRDDRLLTDRDEQILLRLADHAAVAIHNAGLFADNAARRQEAEALTELGGAIASSLELEKILSLVVDRACALLGTQRSAVALANAERPGIATHFVASRGMSRAFPALRPLHPRDGTTPTAIAERRPVWSADLLNDPAFELTPSTRAAVEAEGYRAVLSVPLLVGERVLGALVTYRDDIGPFSESQVELMQAFAHQAALALENSRLYEESERRGRESEVFAEVAQALTSSLDLDTVLRRITDSAKELVGSDLAMIGFREGDSEAVTVRHRVGSRYGSDRTFTIEPGKGFGGQALLTGRPLRTDDYTNDPAVGKEYLGAVVRDDSVSAMVVPIKSEARVVGLLYVANRSRRPFGDRDEATLLRLADEAAVAIRNAQLFASERESERRYRTLVESSIQGIHIQRDWVTLFVNPAFARMLGYDGADELVGLDTRRWLAPHELARLDSDRAARLRGEAVPSRYELQAARRDGSLIWVEIQVAEILWEREPAVQSTVLDITERMRAEQALRQSEAQLRQVQKMEAVGQLAGGVAHDFNNLLTVITGRTELLLLRLAADDPHRRDVDLVRKTADRAASLTQQLLAFSRKQMLQPRVLDLNGVVAGMAQMLKPLIGETIELDTLLAPTLGRVKADPAQIEQIVLNLAVNARDAMPQGGRLTIETGNVELDDAFVATHPGASLGPHAMLSVRDTGAGMTPDVQAHVFEPFFTTKGVGKGTGLGLATVYGIVKQHGGYIRVESAPGAGTVMRIYLARVAPVPDDSAPAADAPAAVGSGTVLVVEDEGELRELATEVLEIAGYAVLSAGSPSAALEIARRHSGPIHLLLTDVVMPEMSGRDLADRLVQSRPGLKILYMSGYTDDAIVHHGVLDPGTVLLQKPFTPDRLT
ncbi:MAG TPA: GAF domain-containing protein, partial [Methylomirabilota bacterium]|nr:GAF domain-containing protein [Methylomirabilota bacterium]